MEFVRGRTVFDMINGLRDEASRGGGSSATSGDASAADTVLLPGSSAAGPAARLSSSAAFSHVATTTVARKTEDFDRIARAIQDDRAAANGSEHQWIVGSRGLDKLKLIEAEGLWRIDQRVQKIRALSEKQVIQIHGHGASIIRKFQCS